MFADALAPFASRSSAVMKWSVTDKLVFINPMLQLLSPWNNINVFVGLQTKCELYTKDKAGIMHSLKQDIQYSVEGSIN